MPTAYSSQLIKALVIVCLIIVSLLGSSGALFALEYPATPPGPVTRSLTADHAVLENAAIRGTWRFEQQQITSLTLDHRQSGRKWSIGTGHMPRVIWGDGQQIDLASLAFNAPPRLEGDSLVCDFSHRESGLELRWSATLADGSNAIIHSLRLAAAKDIPIDQLVFIDTRAEGARQIGRVAGSVVVCHDFFTAIEHPLADNTVTPDSRVRCRLPRGNVLQAGKSWSYSSAIGVLPAGQTRRGFLYYLEQRRARPYRQFLHYNNWYDVILARPPSERMTDAECLEKIAIYGRELVEKRDVQLEAFVWDDGWDDVHSLWRFHKGLPEGFKNLNRAARRYGAAQGVWMSPWGGYARAKQARMRAGEAHGYETNAAGFSMAGEIYGRAFRDACLHMMRDQGVVFFKFDGMGAGNEATGATAHAADDIDAMLELVQTLRHENPEVFISATVGTWASPFWTWHADSIWRQGGDNGLFGAGDTRQQWITYRDKWCHDRIVTLGPLYPLNSVMLHGLLVGDKRSPARIALNEQSVADEIWSFFGSGTCLQELYANPQLLTPSMWDQLAAAANWARANQHVLVDSHWVGGSPGEAEVYGWASWQPGKGILVLRNPSDERQTFDITPMAALELPADTGPMKLVSIYPEGRPLPDEPVDGGSTLHLSLEPFEVIVMEMLPVTAE